MLPYVPPFDQFLEHGLVGTLRGETSTSLAASPPSLQHSGPTRPQRRSPHGIASLRLVYEGV